MKKAIIYSIAAVATMMAACTSDETSTQQTAPKGEGIPFSATITTGSLTRALTEATDGKTIDAAWADGSMPTDGVVSHKFPLEQWETGFEYAATGKADSFKVALIP